VEETEDCRLVFDHQDAGRLGFSSGMAIH
jgi:hypothetical protein